MFYNYHEDYQYDSCIAKGICSINPRTSSLREVLVMYLKQLAFYTLQLKYMGVKNSLTEDIILNTLSGLMSNLETGNEQFYQTLVDLKNAGVDIVTIGQYIQPSKAHLPVAKYYTLEEFENLRKLAEKIGFKNYQIDPLVRSSYKAALSWQEGVKARG